MATETPETTPTPAPAETTPKAKAFYRKPIGCLVTLLLGTSLFVVLLAIFGLWFAGSNFAVGIGSNFVNQKSGGNLTVGENHTNLFAGRVHYKNLQVTNPSRFNDKEFVTINELKAVVDLSSLPGEVKHAKEVILDIGCVSLVGSEKWMSDNNAFDFKKAFAGDPATEKPVEPTEPKKESAPVRFKIDKLVIKLDRLRAISHATTPGQAPRVVFDKEVNLNWTFEDVTDANLTSKVYPVILSSLKQFGSIGLAIGGSIITDATGNLLETGTNIVTGTVGAATDVATGTINAVGKGVSGAIGGLIGGLTGKDDKKEEEPKK